MFVRGINDTYTQGTHEVALDLSIHPDEEVISKLQPPEGIKASVLNGVVVLKAHAVLPVTSRDIDTFVDAYHATESKIKKAEEDAKNERKQMLSRISASLHLPLTSQLSEED